MNQKEELIDPNHEGNPFIEIPVPDLERREAYIRSLISRKLEISPESDTQSAGDNDGRSPQSGSGNFGSEEETREATKEYPRRD